MNTIDEKMKQDIKKAIYELKKSKDTTITYYFTFEIDEYSRRWAIVLAWKGDYEEYYSEWCYGEYRIAMKLAFQPTNSIMQEYDIDWTMPWDEKTGYVDDCETSIDCEEDIDSNIDYLFKTWERYKDNYTHLDSLKW